MPDPYFFFCYSRADINPDEPYVEKLFEDLRVRVAGLAALGITLEDPDRDEKLNRVGFRDQNGVNLADAWRAQIGRAVQQTSVLVCLYSPNFFSPLQIKQFCGKEFTAFLLRNKDVHYVGGAGPPDEKLQLRGVRNIVPILWDDPQSMKKREIPLPPYLLNDIQDAPSVSREDADLITLYRMNGLRNIMIGQRIVKYRRIKELLAQRIFSLTNDPPIPPLPQIPDIEKLRNAFWQPPHDKPLDDAPPPPAPKPILADAAPGSEQVTIVQVRRPAKSELWFPFAGEDSMAAAVEQLKNSKRLAVRWLNLDPGDPGFVATVAAVLEEAGSGRLLLVLDAPCLADEASRTAIVRLLRQERTAGLLVLADGMDADATALVAAHKGEVEAANQSGKWVIRMPVSTMKQFYIAADSVASDLLARLVLTKPVRPDLPVNSGPSERPRMTNRLDRQAA
jgi:hypothetical protein